MTNFWKIRDLAWLSEIEAWRDVWKGTQEFSTPEAATRFNAAAVALMETNRD